MTTVKAQIAIGAGFAALIVLAISPAAVAQEVSIKIAVVDLERVVALSEPGQELQKKLENFQKSVQTEGDGMAAQARDIRQRISDGVNSLSEDKLTQLQKEFEDKTIDIRRFKDDKQREGQKMQGEGLRAIEVLLQPIFEEIRDASGYDLILNNVAGVVVMANANVDITQKVVDKLNEKQGGG